MTLHDDVALACENAEAWNCTVMDDHGNVGVPVSTLRAILARHPAPPVSEGDALAKAFADYESTREDVARRTDPMRANSLLLAGAGLANAVKDHLAQLQVQAPVGEGLENSVSDGEREAYRFWRNAYDAWLEAHDRTERAAALREAADAIVRSDMAFPGMTIRDAVRETLARADRIERGE